MTGSARSACSASSTQRCGSEPELAALAPLLATPPVAALLAGIFGASPYLTSLIERHPASLARALLQAPEDRFAALSLELADTVAAAGTAPDAMRALRVFKNDVALLTALCDLADVWPVMTITRRLSEAADAAVTAAVELPLSPGCQGRRLAQRRNPPATSCWPWASTAPSSSTTPPTST